MVALYSAGLAAGAYRIALPGSVQASAVIVAVILGALGVGWIEEVAFRGVMYGAARAVLGVPGAALATSLLFSLIHFADPIPFHSVAYPDWKDGLLLLGSLFRFVHGPDYYIPYAATLLVMGLVLCRVYETTGGVIACIGLHAGWVAGLFGLKEWLVREPGVATAAFGSGSNPATGWAALLLLTAWLVLVGRPRGGTHADAQRSTVA
jgi:membrane protease YdiL (CAAX protease family)